MRWVRRTGLVALALLMIGIASPVRAGAPERLSEAKKYLRWYVEGRESRLRKQEVFARHYCQQRRCRVLADQAKGDGLLPPRTGPAPRLPDFEILSHTRKCAPLRCHYDFKIRFVREPKLGRLERVEKLTVSVDRSSGNLTNAYRPVPPRPGQPTGFGAAPWLWGFGLLGGSLVLWLVLFGLLTLGTRRRRSGRSADGEPDKDELIDLDP